MSDRPTMPKDPSRDLVIKHSGPAATVYSCPFCKHTLSFRKSRGGGRGYGLRMGGTLHSKMCAHIRAEHPEEMARTGEEAFHAGERFSRAWPTWRRTGFEAAHKEAARRH